VHGIGDAPYDVRQLNESAAMIIILSLEGNRFEVLKEVCYVGAKCICDGMEQAGREAVDAHLVSLHLLRGHADLGGQLLLGKAHRLSAQA